MICRIEDLIMYYVASSVYRSFLHVINLLVHRVPRSIFVLRLLLITLIVLLFFYFYFGPQDGIEKDTKLVNATWVMDPLRLHFSANVENVWCTTVYILTITPLIFFSFHIKHCRAICLSLFAAAGFSLISYSFGHSFPVTAICTITETQNVI